MGPPEEVIDLTTEEYDDAAQGVSEDRENLPSFGHDAGKRGDITVDVRVVIFTDGAVRNSQFKQFKDGWLRSFLGR